MNLITNHWEKHTIFSRKIQDTIRVFKESKDQTTFSADMDGFKKAVDNKHRAVFVGVCRGKLSEGTNLEGNYCRSVIVVGLPFPSARDPKVIETREFHKNHRNDDRGSVWYTNQMRRALNQAFGRVIRSRKDFGMLFLCDPRFVYYRFGSSDWMLPFYPTCTTDDYKKVEDEIEQHFFAHDIDVSEFKSANGMLGSNGGGGGAFELDKVVKRNPNKRNPLVTNPLANKQPSTSNSIVEQSQVVEKQAPPQPVQQTAAERQADLVKSYTVAPAEFDRIKNSRQQLKTNGSDKTGAPAAKRAKTTLDIFNSVTEHDEQSKLISEAPQKCYICSNKPEPVPCKPCACLKVSCLMCLKGLINKTCGDCKTKINTRRFHYLLFAKKSN